MIVLVQFELRPESAHTSVRFECFFFSSKDAPVAHLYVEKVKSITNRVGTTLAALSITRKVTMDHGNNDPAAPVCVLNYECARLYTIL